VLLHGPVRVPEEAAATGRARITLSFSGWKGVAPAAFEVLMGAKGEGAKVARSVTAP
jgi:hypothetical protein